MCHESMKVFLTCIILICCRLRMLDFNFLIFLSNTSASESDTDKLFYRIQFPRFIGAQRRIAIIISELISVQLIWWNSLSEDSHTENRNISFVGYVIVHFLWDFIYSIWKMVLYLDFLLWHMKKKQE